MKKNMSNNEPKYKINIKLPIRCKKCGETHKITDHIEFGLPGGYRYWCHTCDNLWGKMK